MPSPREPFFDEEKFRRSLPFEVRATSVAGVFETPPLPPDFDPRTATAEQCRRAGMLWRRSVANRNPIARALWNRATARSYTRVDETAGPRPRMTMPARRRRRLPNEGGGYNTWAGPVVMTGTWTGVIGSWVVPTVSQGSQPATTNAEGFTGWWMSTWVGLDGWELPPTSSNNCLQIGIYQNIDTHNNASAWAWYEWWLENPPSNAPKYVNAQPISGFDVAPGDTLLASVAYAAGVGGAVTLLNQRNGNFVHKVLAPPPGASLIGNSAEWIVEDPGGGEPDYALAAFTPVVFTSALACNCDSTLANMVFADPSSASIENIPTSSSDSTLLTATTTGRGTATITYVG